MNAITEADAKRRWCPFARVAYAADSIRPRPDLGEQIVEHLPAAVSGNRPLNASTSCIASACMAWRIEPDHYLADTLGGHTLQIGLGYCGLAGQPQ